MSLARLSVEKGDWERLQWANTIYRFFSWNPAYLSFLFQPNDWDDVAIFSNSFALSGCRANSLHTSPMESIFKFIKEAAPRRVNLSDYSSNRKERCADANVLGVSRTKFVEDAAKLRDAPKFPAAIIRPSILANALHFLLSLSEKKFKQIELPIRATIHDAIIELTLLTDTEYASDPYTKDVIDRFIPIVDSQRRDGSTSHCPFHSSPGSLSHGSKRKRLAWTAILVNDIFAWLIWYSWYSW